ncbi:MAG: hypothetical protein ACRCYX_04035 [Dermatophilaceae bacterium]
MLTATVRALVRVARALDGCPDVPVVGVAADRAWFSVGPVSVDLVELVVHAGSPREGQVLADTLGLVEDKGRNRVLAGAPGCPPRAWRTWVGWVADASHDAPVRVEVVALGAASPNAGVVAHRPE